MWISVDSCLNLNVTEIDILAEQAFNEGRYYLLPTNVRKFPASVGLSKDAPNDGNHVLDLIIYNWLSCDLLPTSRTGILRNGSADHVAEPAFEASLAVRMSAVSEPRAKRLVYRKRVNMRTYM
jgi:hypothetical protein